MEILAGAAGAGISYLLALLVIVLATRLAWDVYTRDRDASKHDIKDLTLALNQVTMAIYRMENEIKIHLTDESRHITNGHVPKSKVV